MGNKGATFAKRQREQAKRDRAKERADRRAQQRAKRNGNGPPRDESGGDPDIDWIVPGPQPRSDEE